MELRHLRYFVAVAEELHFGRAAERLHITQPPLSQQIADLEKELGVRLLERTKRRVQLTDAGRLFLQGAQDVLAQAETIVRTAQRASRGEVGTLSVGFVPVADLSVLPWALPIFRGRFPKVQLALHSLHGAAQIEALREGRIDVGLLYLPFTDDTLVVEPILDEPLIVVLPERHPLARRRQIRLRLLATEPFIFFPRHRHPGFYDLIVSFCRQADFSLMNVVQEADHIQTSLGLTAMGIGVSLQPASIQALHRRGVVYRPLRPPVPRVTLAIAFRRGNPSEVLRAFLGIVREAVSRHRGAKHRTAASAADSLSRSTDDSPGR